MEMTVLFGYMTGLEPKLTPAFVVNCHSLQRPAVGTEWQPPGLKNEAKVRVPKNCSPANVHFRLAPKAS